MKDDLIEILPEHAKVADEYLMLIQLQINPKLRAAPTKAKWRAAMDWRHRATDEFWAKMTEYYPEIKGMGCGLVSGAADDGRLRHLIVVQGPLETIKADLASGKAPTLNIRGSEMYELMRQAKQRGFLDA